MYVALDIFTIGTSYREYFTTMRWIFEISIATRLSVSWWSIDQVNELMLVTLRIHQIRIKTTKLIIEINMSIETNLSWHFYFFSRTLAQHCHNIERLDLSDCKKITDQAIYAISKHCAKLSTINLESCVNITDKSLKNLADGCPVSYLNNNKNITKRPVVMRIQFFCPLFPLVRICSRLIYHGAIR